MVRILNGNSDIGAHVCYLICFRHLIWSRAVTNWIFFSLKRHILLHACATSSELLSYITSMLTTFMDLSENFAVWRRKNCIGIMKVFLEAFHYFLLHVVISTPPPPPTESFFPCSSYPVFHPCMRKFQPMYLDCFNAIRGNRNKKLEKVNKNLRY